MKHFAILWVFIFIAALIAWHILSTPVPMPVFKEIADSPTPTVKMARTNQYTIFVPYWSISGSSPKIDAKYSEVVYFGIAANSSGIETTEDGYKDIKVFNGLVGANQKKLLTLRMLDNSDNSKILSNIQIQQEIINQTINIAKNNGFDGVVIDMELQSLPFSSIVDQIDKFYDKFHQQTKQNNLSFDTTMYGDLFYRPRPFDLTYLNKDVDKVYIMAYDLHKASGQPGPNFPLQSVSNDNSDYNLSKMISDYEIVVQADKLVVVFGMFGYDWTVDSKEQTIGSGTALSDLQIQQQFLNHCYKLNCTISRDRNSQETVIHYTDNGQSHIIWFEDLVSSEAKMAYLHKKGITNFGYWAYSYF